MRDTNDEIEKETIKKLKEKLLYGNKCKDFSCIECYPEPEKYDVIEEF